MQLNGHLIMNLLTDNYLRLEVDGANQVGANGYGQSYIVTSSQATKCNFVLETIPRINFFHQH
jgi:hypothetical protein